MINETGTMIVDDVHSTVSWRAVLAGGIATAALTLVLLAFGVGMGFSVVSPWADSGVSASTFGLSAGIFMIVVAMLSSTVGGYLAGRMRAQWTTVHQHERYFRDSAHGFLVWALATVVTAAVLGGATTHIIAGASAGLAPAATSAAQGAPNQSGPATIYVDSLLRTDPAAPAPANAGADTAMRGEVTRLFTPVMRKDGKLADPDRAYLAKVISARTGLSPADADQRVTQVTTQAKADADAARKSAAKLSMWLVAAMLAGALSASLAAIEGGNLRNREWYLTAK